MAWLLVLLPLLLQLISWLATKPKLSDRQKRRLSACLHAARRLDAAAAEGGYCVPGGLEADFDEFAAEHADDH